MEQETNNGQQQLQAYSSSSRGERVMDGDIEDEIQEQLDLQREQLRLESFEGYILVSVLTSTSSFGALVELQMPDVTELTLLHAAVVATSCLSALLGMYSAVTFALIQLYGKTALSIHGRLDKNDFSIRQHCYDRFLERTSNVRVRGFQAAILSLVLFVVEILLVACEMLPMPTLRFPFAAVSSLVVLLLVKDWQFVLNAATPIFVNNNDPDDDPGMDE